MASSTSPTALPAQTNKLPSMLWVSGALAGLGGGIAMALIAAMISLVVGQDLWLEAKQIAAFLYGPAMASQSGFVAGPVLVGSLIHLVISAALGAVFGVLFGRVLHLPTDIGVPLLSGIIYGMLIWVLAYFIVLPLANSTLEATYAPAFIIQHLVYGGVTGLIYTRLKPAPYHPNT